MNTGAAQNQSFSIRNRTRGTLVAERVQIADTPRSRRIGLLKHASLQAGEGLWIYPSQAIHTVGMRFPIDVLFLDRKKRVKRVYHRLAPFRLTRLVWGAESVVEVAPGVIRASGTEVGDELEFIAPQATPGIGRPARLGA